MNVDQLNAKYDEVYNKNLEIQQLLTEVEDYNDILFYLYDTEIKKPNVVLNTMIDNYEGLIFKIRESHKEIKEVLAEFGDEKELADGISANENLTDKIKELILWKLRRLYMVFDEEPILPYVEGAFLNTELIGEPKLEEVSEPAQNGADEDESESEEENGNDNEEENEDSKVSPEGGVFSNKN